MCRGSASVLCALQGGTVPTVPREREAGARYIRGGGQCLTLWSIAHHNPDLTFQWLVV